MACISHLFAWASHTTGIHNKHPTPRPCCCCCLLLPAARLQALRASLELNFALNSKAFLIEHSSDLVEFVGNRTECALLMLGRKWGADYKALRDQHQANIANVRGLVGWLPTVGQWFVGQG
jgi:hypothetical protein